MISSREFMPRTTTITAADVLRAILFGTFVRTVFVDTIAGNAGMRPNKKQKVATTITMTDVQVNVLLTRDLTAVVHAEVDGQEGQDPHEIRQPLPQLRHDDGRVIRKTKMHTTTQKRTQELQDHGYIFRAGLRQVHLYVRGQMSSVGCQELASRAAVRQSKD